MDVIITCVVALALAVVFAKKKALPWILFGVAAVLQILSIAAIIAISSNPELAKAIGEVPSGGVVLFGAIFVVIDVVAIIFISKRKKAAKAAETEAE